MSGPGSSDPSLRARSRETWAERILLAVLCAAILWLYGWYASPSEPLFGRFGGKEDYYNLLIRGFAKGHLWMDVTPDPAFASLPDPYTPSKRIGTYLHDATFYRGRYYMYFGATPALVLYGPFHTLTGWYLRDQQAVPIFVGVGFLAGVFLLFLLRRRHFPGIGTTPFLMGIVAWGGLPLLFALIRRPRFWEAPIACGYAFLVLALLCLAQWHESGRKARWIALGSLAYGLAIASRPTYLFGSGCLVIPALLLWAEQRRLGQGARRAIEALIAASAPVGAIVAGLLVYNYERFGEFLNFGWRYQLTYNDELNLPHFAARFIPQNLYNNFLAPARLGAFFPYFFPIDYTHGPAGYQGVEDPYGLLVNAPFLLLALAAVFVTRKSGPLRGVALSVAAVFFGVTPMLMGFFSACNRYEVDFGPSLTLLAVIGFWGLWGARQGSAKAVYVAVASALLAWSLAFNLLAAIGHNSLMRLNDRRTYEALTAIAGEPRYLLHELLGGKYGPIELSLRFPSHTSPRIESIVTTGHDDLSDYLYVSYPDSDHIVLGFEHTGFGGVNSGPLAINRSAVHSLRVAMGSFYPPLNDPYYRHVGIGDRRRREQTLSVTLDGKGVLTQVLEFYPGISPQPQIGYVAHNQSPFKPFSGRILSLRRLDADTTQSYRKEEAAGAFALTLRFPADKPGLRDPLISAGAQGKADILLVHYLDATHVQFGLDHWAVSYLESPVVHVAPGERQNLVVSFGSFYPEGERPADMPAAAWEAARHRLVLVLNGKVILDEPQEFYPAPDASICLGLNPLGASTCAEEFSGTLYNYQRLTHGFPAFPVAASPQ